MTDQTINRLTIGGAIFAGLALTAIVYLTYYTPPTPPPIDPRKVELLEATKDSLNAANVLKTTHTETVAKAESVKSQKAKVLNEWGKIREVRRSLSDSLQAQMLIDRLDK